MRFALYPSDQTLTFDQASAIKVTREAQDHIKRPAMALKLLACHNAEQALKALRAQELISAIELIRTDAGILELLGVVYNEQVRATVTAAGTSVARLRGSVSEDFRRLSRPTGTHISLSVAERPPRLSLLKPHTPHSVKTASGRTTCVDGCGICQPGH